MSKPANQRTSEDYSHYKSLPHIVKISFDAINKVVITTDIKGNVNEHSSSNFNITCQYFAQVCTRIFNFKQKEKLNNV